MSPRSGPVAALNQNVIVQGNLDFLVGEVEKACPRPLNVLQVAAVLETAGVTDALAQRRYARNDVFALAEEVTSILEAQEPGTPHPTAPETEMMNSREAWLDYIRGPLGLLPMILLSIIIAIYQGFGKWGGEEVIVLSFSMVGSLLVTGGFVQAMTRKGLSYLSQGYVKAAYRITAQVIGVGVLAVLLTTALLVVSARLTQVVSERTLPLFIVSYFTLSCLWLASAILSMLNSIHWFGIGLGVGGGLSYAALQLLDRFDLSMNLIMLLATIIGFLGALAIMGIATRRALAAEAGKSKAKVGKKVILTPYPHLVVNLAPYFAYGVVYVLFIVSGHIPGWLGRLPAEVDRVDALATVEMGLTLALSAYILASGVAERTMARFWEIVQPYQRRTTLSNAQAFSKSVEAFYRRERAYFLRALLLCNLLVIFAGVAGLFVGNRTGWSILTWTPQASLVAFSGLIGYALMALGIFNAMFMITLSRPGLVLLGLILGILVTLVTGGVVGQIASYPYATLSLPAGSLIFLLASRQQLGELLSHADYYYYASF